MKKILFFLCWAIILPSCQTDDSPYSYLSNPDITSDMVLMKYKVTDSSSPFNYIFRAGEMYVEWGDSSKPTDFVFKGSTDSVILIKAISHNYSSPGDYDIKLKALKLVSIDISQTGSNVFSELELHNCLYLKNLHCKNQPIAELNISNCPVLEELSCGYSEGELNLSDLSVLKQLRILYVNGALSNNYPDLSLNDSLKTVSFNETNFENIQLTNLKALTNITINNCSRIKNIYLLNNVGLKQLVISNNTALEATALNEMFESLPSVSGIDNIIVLKGNKGDSNCNRYLATSKGWVFKNSL